MRTSWHQQTSVWEVHSTGHGEAPWRWLFHQCNRSPELGASRRQRLDDARHVVADQAEASDLRERSAHCSTNEAGAAAADSSDADLMDTTNCMTVTWSPVRQKRVHCVSNQQM